MSPEWKCPLNRGVPKERFYCNYTNFLFQAFCLLSEAKEEEVKKGRDLLVFYNRTKELLCGMTENDLELLQKHVGNIEKNFTERMDQLTHKECFLLVAGNAPLACLAICEPIHTAFILFRACLHGGRVTLLEGLPFQKGQKIAPLYMCKVISRAISANKVTETRNHQCT